MPVPEQALKLARLLPARSRSNGNGSRSSLGIQPSASFLLCLDADIAASRLVHLWRLQPNGLSCRERCGSGRLLQCIAVLLRNGRYEDPALSDRLRQLFADVTPASEGVGLTLKEERIVRMVAGGRSSREIGAQLVMRADSVREVFCDLYDKTGV